MSKHMLKRILNPLAAAFIGAAAHILSLGQKLNGTPQRKTRHSGIGEDRRSDKKECPNALLRRYSGRHGGKYGRNSHG